MKRKIRVLHVISNFGLGGAEVWIIALLKFFKECEAELPVTIESDVFLTNGEPSYFDSQALDLGATLFYSRYSRETIIRFVHDWRCCLKNRQYDVIHDHQEFSAGWHFLMGAGLLPKVTIAHLHNPMSHQISYSSSVTRKMILSIGNRLIARFATNLLSTSAQLIDEHGFNSKTFKNLSKEAVHCGFDTSRFLGDTNADKKSICLEFGLPFDSRILLFVGRLDSHQDQTLNQKNPSFCLEIARCCADVDPGFFCLIAGGGARMQTLLEERVRGWGLLTRILFLGPRTDVPRLMRGASALILPSISEGLGMVAVEAQASGLPVIASDAVPRECAVVDELVDFLPLSAGAEFWATAVFSRFAKTSRDIYRANSKVKSSKFSIHNSAGRLSEIYQGLRVK